MHDYLSPAWAAAVAHAGRLLLRARKITHHHHSLLQVLLWGGLCRHGRAALEASFTRLEDRAPMAWETVAAGVRRLAELGLLVITERRIHVAWGGAVASRQATSRYRLVVPVTESGGPTVPQGLEILVVEVSVAQREATARLVAIAARRKAERDIERRARIAVYHRVALN